jgi:hypothetical protein
VCAETIDRHSSVKLCRSRSATRDHGAGPVDLSDTDSRLNTKVCLCSENIPNLRSIRLEVKDMFQDGRLL